MANLKVKLVPQAKVKPFVHDFKVQKDVSFVNMQLVRLRC